jgi:hypothetical protein
MITTYKYHSFLSFRNKERNKRIKLTRFKVLTVVSTKMAVIWRVAPLSVEEVCIRLRGACCLNRQGDETSVNLCPATRRNIPEDSRLQE